jgi:hypothetical protein
MHTNRWEHPRQSNLKHLVVQIRFSEINTYLSITSRSNRKKSIQSRPLRRRIQSRQDEKKQKKKSV